MEGYNNHVKLVEDKEKENLQIFIELNDEIKRQSEVSSDWSDKTTTELHSIQGKIEKFLLEDLRRDAPTGNFLDFYANFNNYIYFIFFFQV